jgi:hypothetical protein
MFRLAVAMRANEQIAGRPEIDREFSVFSKTGQNQQFLEFGGF